MSAPFPPRRGSGLAGTARTAPPPPTAHQQLHSALPVGHLELRGGVPRGRVLGAMRQRPSQHAGGVRELLRQESYCNCRGECHCDAGYGGSYCQISCPRFNGLVCGGPTRGSCFDVTGNGTCHCYGYYVGAACQSVCDCSNPTYGSCSDPSRTGVCVCNARRSGAGCRDCAAGWRGELQHAMRQRSLLNQSFF